MTITTGGARTARRATPPFSRSIQIAVGVCLVLAGITNGLSQYIGELVVPDGEFSDQIRWGADHVLFQQLEQNTLLASALFMPLGLLGIAQITRWRAPRLTAVATVLFLWGMWGFHNVLGFGYVAGTVAPDALDVNAAVTLNDGLIDNPGVIVTALLPHLIGSFLGLLVLTAACWRSRTFPRIPLVLLVAFLIWDFTLPPVGFLEAHLLLFISWAWMGVHVMRMSHAEWLGRTSADQQS